MDVQVARYTALLSGIIYGLYHRSTLQKARDVEREHHAAERRERLIAEAKELWKKRASSSKDSGESIARLLHSFRGLASQPSFSDLLTA
jgi:hypothetical protein